MRRFTKAYKGQVSVIFAIALVGLIGILGLSIDAGYVMAERRQAQSAADSAALAAALALYDEQFGAITPSGQNYATENSDALAADVQVSWPPATGAYSGDQKYVQVSMSQEVRKFFVGALYSGDWKVSASATAGIETKPANYALIALKETDPPGIHLNGNTAIEIVGGDVGAGAFKTHGTDCL